MNTVKLIKWGNSIGVRIPASILKEAHLHLGEKLNIVVNKKGKISLEPVKNSQTGWTEAFNAIADSQHKDEGLMQIPNDFDEKEWTW